MTQQELFKEVFTKPEKVRKTNENARSFASRTDKQMESHWEELTRINLGEVRKSMVVPR